MKRYNIQTEEVKQDDYYCPVCKNGEIWKHEPLTYMTDEFGDEYDTHLCNECHTLYKIPRIPIKGIEIDSKGKDITTETVDEFDLEKETLTNENMGMFLLKINQDLIKEGRKMWKQILEEKESYENFGLHHHIWIKSNPFKTAEGTFQVESCPICNKAKINYNGKEYFDDLNKIINFIAHRGIEHQQKKVSFIPEF
jgi:hypothetical protein